MDTHSRERRLLEAGLTLASELSLQGVLQRIIETAADLTGARYGALGVLGRDGTIADFITTGLTQAERDAIGPLPVGKGILGVLIHEALPLRIANIADDPRSHGFPKNHPPMHSFLGAPIKGRNEVFGNIYLTEKQGAKEFSEEDEEALTFLATQAGVAIENARLYEESVQRTARLSALSEIASMILSGAETLDVLRHVARCARELARGDLATISTPVGVDQMVIEVAEGWDADALRGIVFQRDESIAGEVLRSGEPIVLRDASVDPRVAQPVVARGTIGPAMVVPLNATVSGSLGTILVGNRRHGRQFGDEELDVVRTFAAQAGIALEFGRAQEELRRLSLLEDRERIAKELHDGAIQSLFAVGMGLQAAAMLEPTSDVRRRIESSVEEIDRVIRDLRHYIFGLRPGLLSDKGLEGALRKVAVDLEEKAGVTTVVDVDAEAAQAVADSAGDILQLTREALSNVGRHAAATTARVTLKRDEGRIVLEIEDDGSGFDVAGRTGAGQGLVNLRSRTEQLGGRLQIESKPGLGTLVRIVLGLGSAR